MPRISDGQGHELQLGSNTSLPVSSTTIEALLGALNSTAVIDPTASGSEIALLKGIIKQLQGDGTAGKSAPVSLVGSLANHFEQLTIDATVGGIGLTAATYGTDTKAYITVEGADIRFRIDGTAPTAAIGHLVNNGGIIKLDSASDLAHFKAIRTGAVSATITCTYSA